MLSRLHPEPSCYSVLCVNFERTLQHIDDRYFMILCIINCRDKLKVRISENAAGWVNPRSCATILLILQEVLPSQKLQTGQPF